MRRRDERERAAPIPQQPSDLTAEWFDDALRPHSGGARVTDVVVETVGTGVGFAGEIYRCRLDWDRDDTGAPGSVIVKVPARNPTNRATVEAVGGYEREILVYRELGGRLGLPMPEHLYSDMTPNPAPWMERVVLAALRRLPLRLIAAFTRGVLYLAGRSRRRYILVIEDIHDARAPRQADGGSVEDACAALVVLARFHATNWMATETVEAHPFIAPVNAAPRLLQAAFVRNRDDFVERFADVLHPRAMERLDAIQADLVPTLARMAEPPCTILHGDYRLDNVLFRPSGELVVLDFQVPRWGRPASDVAYFITTALHAANRAGEDEMLRAYHDALTEAGVDDYALTELRRDVEVAKDLLGHAMVSTPEFLDTEVAGHDDSFSDQMARRLLGWLEPSSGAEAGRAAPGD